MTIGRLLQLRRGTFIKRPFSIFKRKLYDMSISTAKSEGELMTESLINETTHGRGPGVTTFG